MQPTDPQRQAQPPAQNQGQDQGQGRRKRSPLVYGLGAAAIASIITVVVMQSQNPATAPASQAAMSPSKQCHMVARRVLVSTEHGGGTVRFRASGYLSPPFALTNKPQVVEFPLPRPDATPVTEAITVEGNATDVVLTSEATDLHSVFDVSGVYNLNLTWAPMKGC
jgi:hypothetical protein